MRVVSGSSAALVRSRWAAFGAALAVALGGGYGVTRATAPAGAAAFVPITPCRLFDTRPEFQVGDRATPLGADETHTLAGTGTVGQCALPADAVGLALNVTAVDATLLTYLTIHPAGAGRPNASSLNPSPGAPPTPNAVNVDLGAGGHFAVYNKQGSVHVFADVLGYYTDHHHDDRYYTKQQTADLVNAGGSIMLEGEAAEFATTTVYESKGMQLRISCGLAPGSVYLELAASSGPAALAYGTLFASGSTPSVWSAPTAGRYTFGGSLTPYRLAATVATDADGPQAWSLVATFHKSAGCPYEILLTPVGSAP